MEQKDLLTEETNYLKRADNSVRFANLIIDTIFYYVVVLIVGALIGLLMFTADEQLASEVFMEEEESPAVTIISYIVGFGVMFLYYFISEATTQRTIGKFFTGTIVVNQSGEKPTSKQIAIRSVSRLVPFEAFSFFGEMGWHDKWSETYVVKKKDLINQG